MTRLLAALRTIYEVAADEFWYLVKGRPPVALVPFIVPLGFAVLFGFVYQQNVVNHIPMVVWDEDQSATSRSLIQAYTDADRFDFVAQVDTEEEMIDALHAGEARVALAIPRDFDKELKSGQGTDFLLMVDSSNNMFGNAAISASQEVSRWRASSCSRARACCRMTPSYPSIPCAWACASSATRPTATRPSCSRAS